MLNKETAYSILDLAIRVEGKSLGETFDEALALAKVADGEGYSRYWLAEHHNSDAIASSAPSILVGKIAEGTERIRVGSGGIMLKRFKIFAKSGRNQIGILCKITFIGDFTFDIGLDDRRQFIQNTKKEESNGSEGVVDWQGSIFSSKKKWLTPEKQPLFLI